MGKKCFICGKTTTFGNKVSHSKIKTRKKQKPNLHYIKVKIGDIGDKVKKVYVCSKCLKANKIRKVI